MIIMVVLVGEDICSTNRKGIISYKTALAWSLNIRSHLISTHLIPSIITANKSTQSSRNYSSNTVQYNVVGVKTYSKVISCQYQTRHLCRYYSFWSKKQASNHVVDI